ncbi:MAG: hypothetical protein WHW07_09180 [Bacteroidales bacterium]|jgi:transposase-like protein|nr:hypothetical protein [Bacteroidales bacterium]HOL97105.1 hypothetical protein [Bacteroidales bacterium]HOM37392.1 hypothetical protein [Bacteroidales bacterium]HPD23110.1 hypothetical protein [Bacteroidales bacterium]HRT00682.1 hypothetical protein [Bacteroidales bacterium]
MKKTFEKSTNKPSKKLLKIYTQTLIVNACPYCRSKKFYVHGKYKFTTRYRCCSCKRTFIPSTGTSIHYLHKKDLFLDFAEIVRDEGILTLKEVCKRLDIANLTAFDWRHKLLNSVPKINKTFNKKIICNEFCITFSQKGRKGIRDESYQSNFTSCLDLNNFSQIISVSDGKFIDNKLATVGPLNDKHIKRILGPKLKNVNKFIYLGKNDSYQKTIGSKTIEFIQPGMISNDTKFEQKTEKIRKNHLGIKIWIGINMKGVATKYLQMYSNYFCYRQIYNFNPIGKLSLNLRYVWSVFTLMENFYKTFIINHTVKDYILPTKRKWKTSFNYSLAGSEIPY